MKKRLLVRLKLGCFHRKAEPVMLVVSAYKFLRIVVAPTLFRESVVGFVATFRNLNIADFRAPDNALRTEPLYNAPNLIGDKIIGHIAVSFR